jgi:hypothetical protein
VFVHLNLHFDSYCFVIVMLADIAKYSKKSDC